MPDYIPQSDADFDNWMSNFATFCNASGTALGLSAADLTAIQTQYGAWVGAYQAHQVAQLSAKSATQTKNMEREETEALARAYARVLQANLNMDDSQRAAAGLSIPDTESTTASPTRIDTTPPPLVLLDWSQRCRAVIHFGPNPSNERNNALPEGMRGCRIEYALGGIPSNEEEWKYLVDDTRSPYIHVLTIVAPMTIAYRVQYFDTKMRLGPKSDPATATITP